MNDLIEILELHFSNKCSGNCVICSKAHGNKNIPFITEKIFDKILDNLDPPDSWAPEVWKWWEKKQPIRTRVIQVGGDGDSFSSPLFIPSLRKLKKRLPGSYVCLFTNFSLFTPEKIDIILKEKLLNEVGTRIDSLNPDIFKLSTHLDLKKVLGNVKYFLSKNETINFGITYFPLYKYPEVCKKVLHKEPTYFKYKEISKGLLVDEEQEIEKYFAEMPKLNKEKFNNRNGGHINRGQMTLWAERTDCEPDLTAICRQLPENDGAFLNQCLIYPNGDVGLCAFDDSQGSFILGNVLKDRLIDIWNSKKRWQLINDIRSHKLQGKYPCINPKACGIYVA